MPGVLVAPAEPQVVPGAPGWPGPFGLGLATATVLENRLTALVTSTAINDFRTAKPPIDRAFSYSDAGDAAFLPYAVDAAFLPYAVKTA
jgi:hypothetical protein